MFMDIATALRSQMRDDSLKRNGRGISNRTDRTRSLMVLGVTDKMRQDLSFNHRPMVKRSKESITSSKTSILHRMTNT
jgi:hypothetical protein